MALPVFKIGCCPFGGRLGSTPRRFRQLEHREIREIREGRWVGNRSSLTSLSSL